MTVSIAMVVYFFRSCNSYASFSLILFALLRSVISICNYWKDASYSRISLSFLAYYLLITPSRSSLLDRSPICFLISNSFSLRCDLSFKSPNVFVVLRSPKLLPMSKIGAGCASDVSDTCLFCFFLGLIQEFICSDELSLSLTVIFALAGEKEVCFAAGLGFRGRSAMTRFRRRVLFAPI
jgi:hypothetical protein